MLAFVLHCPFSVIHTPLNRASLCEHNVAAPFTILFIVVVCIR
jgi:hypothetical protein